MALEFIESLLFPALNYSIIFHPEKVWSSSDVGKKYYDLAYVSNH